jgi:aminoglycoside phosphotransferase (APT) family kinase protein
MTTVIAPSVYPTVWRASLAALIPDGQVIGRPRSLTGGALHEHWSIEVARPGGAERFVLRRTASQVLDSLPRAVEFAVQRAAFEAGVPTPEPLAHGMDHGTEFLLMRHLPGSADPLQVLASRHREGLADALAAALARLHGLTPDRVGLPSLAAPPDDPARATIAAYRAALDRRPRAHPVLEWGLRALERNPPAPAAIVLCHGDFRTGNFLVVDDRLSGLLDWEFARWSDPYEDLGWFCTRYWRRHAGRREAGGLVGRAAFFARYAQAAGRPIDHRRALFWELMANIRWALIALAQADRGVAEGLLERALTGRRLPEIEAEILTLTEQWTTW